MLFADIRQALEEHFETAWAGQTPIAWDNAPFENDEDLWVRFSIKFANSENMTIGGGRQDTPGFISVQIFTKSDTGTGLALQTADAVSAVLQNKTIGNIFTYATSVDLVGDGVRKVNQVEYGEFQTVTKTRFEAT